VSPQNGLAREGCSTALKQLVRSLASTTTQTEDAASADSIIYNATWLVFPLGSVASQRRALLASGQAGDSWSSELVPSLNGFAPPLRYVGVQNVVLGGLVLHQERVEYQPRCHTRFAALMRCTDATRLATVQAHRSGGGFGRDPAFNPTSSLFSPASSEADYYNTSAGSREVDAFGFPFGFFPQPKVGGSFAVFQTAMGRARVLAQLQYLRDAHFVDISTRRLSLSMATFNPLLRAYGWFRLQVTRGNDGLFWGRVTLSACSAVDYSTQLGQRVLTVNGFMTAFSLAHVGVLASHWVPSAIAFMQARAQMGIRSLSCASRNSSCA